MTLTNGKYNLKLSFEENQVTVLIFESSEMFGEAIWDFQETIIGDTGPFVLADQMEPISISKQMELIVDPFLLDFNSRKIQQRLYKEWGCLSENYDSEKAEINRKIIDLLGKLQVRSAYDNVNFQLEFDWEDLFKFYRVQFCMEFQDLEEKICEYIKVMSRLMKIKVLVFVNLKTYLSREQLLRVYQMAFYHKIYLLLLENAERKQEKNENIYIVDRDKCLIIK